MVPATDSARFPRAHRAGFGLALLCLLGGSGCTRLRSFRQEGRPAFGTQTAAEAPGSIGRSAAGDLYAERVGKPQDPENSALARNSRNPPNRGDAVADPAEHPQVALQTPETLPALGGSDRALLAKRTQDVTDGPPQGGPAEEVGADPAGQALGSILAESRIAVEGLAAYQVRMNHQERVGGNLNPAENVLLSVRRNPQAVRLEWLEGPNKGREVIYASDANDGLMHVRMGNPLLPRISIPPDSPLATRNSRHPITEAGYDTIVQKMDEAFRREQANDHSLGMIRYHGLEKPEGFETPCQKVVRVTPTRETWLVYIDPSSHLPVLVQATDGIGELLERYTFRDPTLNPADLAMADAFSPDARWGPSQGLFQRLARGSSETKDAKTR